MTRMISSISLAGILLYLSNFCVGESVSRSFSSVGNGGRNFFRVSENENALDDKLNE